MTAIANTEERVFKPSHYQQAVFDALTAANTDIQVNAVAGSGKTTTLIEGLNRLPLSVVQSTLLAAFNRDIAEALKTKAPIGVTVKTNHSIGFAALGSYFSRIQGSHFKPKVDDNKYKRLIKSFWISNYRTEDQPPGEDEYEMFKLVHFTRVTLTDPADQAAVMEMALARELAMPNPDRMLDALPHILAAGKDVLCRSHHPRFNDSMPPDRIDYDDMIWLPHALNAPPKQYERVLVDEAQDLNAAQLDLLLKCRSQGGWMVFVGDPRQAIYAFCGADSDSWQKIQEKTGAIQLPLSVCYRCPEAVIEVAKQTVPEIEAAPNAPKGKVEDITTADFIKSVSPKDMVLCRVNAPLISMAFKLIAEGKPTKVRGRDIGESLTRIIDNIEKQATLNGGFDFGEFLTYTQSYRENHDRILRKKKDAEAQLASLHDQVDGLEAVYMSVAAAGASTLQALRDKIDDLFSDKENGHILLSSIHKAKGLEAEAVYILHPEKIPHPMATSPAALQQEYNLWYVAVTRSLRDLYLVKPVVKKEESKSNEAAPPAPPADAASNTQIAEKFSDVIETTVSGVDGLVHDAATDTDQLQILLAQHTQFLEIHGQLMRALLERAIQKADRCQILDTMAEHRAHLRHQMSELRRTMKKG